MKTTKSSFHGWWMGSFLAVAVLICSVGLGSNPLSDRETAKANLIIDLDHLGLLTSLNDEKISDLAEFQWQSRQTLAKILIDPTWCQRLGLKAQEFEVTWYMSNPYELLPKDLQLAIQSWEKPFKRERDVYAWCTSKKAPTAWTSSLKKAFVETTPENLWRASQGKRPYAKNGEYLEPIVIESEAGDLMVKDGHIATDPRIIPTNSEVLLLVRINGEEKILKVKAADIGGGIKGLHVDLPVHMRSSGATIPDILFPSGLKNPKVQILRPFKKSTNLDQKA